jgi:CheY-like chemotaxis protein
VAATFKPEVVMLDFGIPKLNGHEAARRIREQPWGKTIRLMVPTGWRQDEDRRNSQEAGFDFHMVKPIEAAALAKIVTEPQTATR